jgi:hypothetical protein
MKKHKYILYNIIIVLSIIRGFVIDDYLLFFLSFLLLPFSILLCKNKENF